MRDTRYMVPGWLRQQAGLGRIGADARSPARTAYGLAIENIERGYLATRYTAGSDYSSLSSTSWVALDSTNLSWSFTASGKRPVELTVSGLVLATATRNIRLSFLWDGVEVTGTTLGMCLSWDSAATDFLTGVHRIDPTAGTHTVAVAYSVSGGASGAVSVSGGASLFVSVKEV